MKCMIAQNVISKLLSREACVYSFQYSMFFRFPFPCNRHRRHRYLLILPLSPPALAVSCVRLLHVCRCKPTLLKRRQKSGEVRGLRYWLQHAAAALVLVVSRMFSNASVSLRVKTLSSANDERRRKERFNRRSNDIKLTRGKIQSLYDYNGIERRKKRTNTDPVLPSLTLAFGWFRNLSRYFSGFVVIAFFFRSMFQPHTAKSIIGW